jgi:uncharacterized damage-inducible protein DinB
MNITTLIAQHLIEVHEGGNWTEIDIASTVKDVSLEEATTRTIATPNTIAALLHHITFWNLEVMQRAKGITTQVDEANGFNHPALNTGAHWQQLKEDNIQSAHKLAAAINQFDETKLFEPMETHTSSAYKNFQGAVEHVHYHLGQIVILKKLIRNTNV